MNPKFERIAIVANWLSLAWPFGEREVRLHLRAGFCVTINGQDIRTEEELNNYLLQ